jgi:1-acyl-sn-glycerol-3-phosphate acyltransferase
VCAPTDSRAAPTPGGPLHVLYEHVATYCGVAFLGVLCLGWSVFAILVPFVLPAGAARRLGRRGITGGFRLYLESLALIGACRFDLSALDALRDEPALVIAANHPSMIDAVLLVSRLPAACILKADLLDSVFLGAGARLAGYIPNNSARQMIVDSVAALHEGSHLLLFPEGTRTTHWPVNAFVGSVGVIARHAGVPVQTVFIDTDSPYLAKGWPLFRRPALPITYRVRLGRRFDPPEHSREFVATLERYFADEVVQAPMLQTWLPAHCARRAEP